MAARLKTKRLRIEGMTCAGCQNKIERKLRNTAGVKSASVSYGAGTADVTYDADILSLEDMIAVIERLDYKALPGDERQTPGIRRAIGLLVIIIALYALLHQFGVLNLLVPSQLAQTDMSYGMLFVIGLITSVHCVAMCGGVNLSQCIPKERGANIGGRLLTGAPALCNLGRVISYTVIGFIAGALGSAVTFSSAMQGVLKLVAGVLMVIMGINMLGIFPWLKRLNPRPPNAFANKIDREKYRGKSPLIVGLLNGLMPCGPMQAVQIYALSTGNPFAGALSMMLFSLGTVPLMFGIGAIGSALGKRFIKTVMTAGAVLIAALGLVMFSQGWSLSGFRQPNMFAGAQPAADAGITIENGAQIVRGTLASGGYPNITVRAGMPVKWIIDAPQGTVNGCNNRMIIPQYSIEHTFKTGENIITFTPGETGTFPYSCWMGMIRGTITVTEANEPTPSAEETPDEPSSDYGCCG